MVVSSNLNKKFLFSVFAGLIVVSLLFNKILMVIFSLSFLLLGTCSLFQISWHYIQRVNAFPVILDFNADWSGSFVHFNNTEMEASSPVSLRKIHVMVGCAMRTKMPTGRYLLLRQNT